MRQLSKSCLRQISGGAELVFDISQRYTTNHYSSVAFTLQYDGSMPPELQARIDAGESYDSMKMDLFVYSLMYEQCKMLYPDLFQ